MALADRAGVSDGVGGSDRTATVGRISAAGPASVSPDAVVGSVANFVVTISFLTIKNAIGTMGVFLLFGSLTLVALLYFWREVPETKGRSLQELERDLAGRAVG